MCVDFMQEYVDIFVWQDMLSNDAGEVVDENEIPR